MYPEVILRWDKKRTKRVHYFNEALSVAKFIFLVNMFTNACELHYNKKKRETKKNLPDIFWYFHAKTNQSLLYENEKINLFVHMF